MTANEVHAAIEGGDQTALKTLLAADPTLAAARDAHGVSALMKAVYWRKLPLLPTLLAAGQPLDIFEAAALRREDRVRDLLSGEPTLATSWSPDGFTPLHIAAYCDSPACAQLLLGAGAAPGAVARNAMAVQPLHSAASARAHEVVRMLLEAGADPDARQHEGWTALHAAGLHGDRALAELLLRHGADRTLVADNGKDAATLAADAGHGDFAATLRASGA